MEIKKILVPTDFSEEATIALHAAVEIAGATNAEIAILHVVDVPNVDGVGDANDGISLQTSSAPQDSDSPSLAQMFMHKLMEVTRERMEEYKSHIPDNITVKEHVVFDEMAKSLADFVVKDETDLIVMGSEGASGIEEITVGSNAEKVIRTAKAPVLTVKGGLKDNEFKKIVFASSFLKVSEKAVNSLKAFQKIFSEAEIHFVKVITPNTFETTEDTQDLINSFAREHKFENFTASSYNHYTEEEGIRAFAESVGADLIAMTTHGRTGISHMLFGSIAEEVANHSNIPVLTFNQKYK